MEIEVFKIIGVFGIKGEVKIYSYFEDIKSIQNVIFCKNRKLEIKKITKSNRNIYFVSFEGIQNRNDAEKLIGIIFYIHRDKMPTLVVGEYYEFEIRGYNVYENNDDIKIYLGEILEVMHTPNEKLLIIKSAIKRGNYSNGSIMVNKSDIQEINKEEKTIIIKKLPEIIELFD